MKQMNEELKEVAEVLNTQKTICLLAPSFPVDFEFPNIISDLRTMGFSKIMELTYAAKLINYRYIDVINDNPEKQYICGNCPTIIKLVENQYPEHKDKLLDVASPMVVMARFVKREFGEEYKTIFVGPCFAKKNEAKENPDCIDFALTFKELVEIYDYLEELGKLKKISDTKENNEFDKFYNDVTKIYPLGGGVASSMITKDILNLDEVIVCDGPDCIAKAMTNLKQNKKIRFVDILFCKGGCIGGPGIICNDNLEKRKEKIFEYKDKAKEFEPENNYGKFVHAFGLDIKRKTP